MSSLTVVDDQNQIQGFSSKEDVMRRGLNYRCIQVFVFNDKDELLICRRPDSKTRYAGKFASSAMGYIRKDENFEDAAKREMMQELGLNIILKKTCSFMIQDGDSKVFQEIWRGATSEDIHPDDTEIAEYKFVGLDDLSSAMDVNPENFAVPFVEAVKAFIDAKAQGFPREKMAGEEQAGLKDFK